jgi:hypothetical protein
MKPLRPDGHGLTSADTLSRHAGAGARFLPGGLGARRFADPPARPRTDRPLVGLYLTPEELELRPGLPGALGELLPHIATADSITFDSGGTGAPGFETWKQWSERLAPQAALEGPTAVLARRTLAYTRTRAALAAGPNWIGWQASKTARAALAGAEKDVAAGRRGRHSWRRSRGGWMRCSSAGKEPPRPAPAKVKRKRRPLRLCLEFWVRRRSQPDGVDFQRRGWAWVRGKAARTQNSRHNLSGVMG